MLTSAVNFAQRLCKAMEARLAAGDLSADVIAKNLEIIGGVSRVFDARTGTRLLASHLSRVSPQVPPLAPAPMALRCGLR